MRRKRRKLERERDSGLNNIMSYMQMNNQPFSIMEKGAISEDQRLARMINALCMVRIIIIEERDNFVDKLDVLAGRFIPDKMVEFIKESQDKDTQNLMKLQILGREFGLRVAERNIFIEKLKGNMDY
ncbi:hypothetical protein Tco_1516843 [Tanacetum coccineum]